MKDLFLKRKQEFRKECLGYLRYVLNDHFVLFLLVLLGFLAYQYNQLLQHWDYICFTVALGWYCDLSRSTGQTLSLGS